MEETFGRHVNRDLFPDNPLKYWFLFDQDKYRAKITKVYDKQGNEIKIIKEDG